ncbi:MAG: hypothetical protein ACI9WC_001095 [Arenicella sp.]
MSANERDYSVLSSRHLEPNKAAAVEVEGVTLIEIEPNEFDEALNIHLENEGSEELFPDQNTYENVESLAELESKQILDFTFKGETVADDVYDLSESDLGAQLTVDLDDRLDHLFEERNFDFALSLLNLREIVRYLMSATILSAYVYFL